MRSLIAVFVVALVAAGGCSGGHQKEVDGPTPTAGSIAGPIQVPEPHGWSVGVEVGVAFTDGLEVLRLEGDRPAVITHVRIEGDEGLNLVGAQLVGPSRAVGAVQFADSWPPVADPDLGDETFLPLDTAITPITQDSGGWELLLGLRADRAGAIHRTAVIIEYLVGERAYVQVRPAELLVCAAEGAPPGNCSTG